MSIRNIFRIIIQNIIIRNVSSNQESIFPIRRELKVKKCPCNHNVTIIENETVQENIRAKHRRVKKKIDGILKEMEKRNSFNNVEDK